MFSRPTPTRADAERERAIESSIAEAIALAGPESVLAEYPIYQLRLGERPVLQPFIMSQLAREGTWDPAPLLADIRRGRFRWLLTTQEIHRDQAFNRWAPEFVAVFREVFVPRTKFTRLEGREQMILYEYTPRL